MKMHARRMRNFFSALLAALALCTFSGLYLMVRMPMDLWKDGMEVEETLLISGVTVVPTRSTSFTSSSSNTFSSTSPAKEIVPGANYPEKRDDTIYKINLWDSTDKSIAAKRLQQLNASPATRTTIATTNSASKTPNIEANSNHKTITAPTASSLHTNNDNSNNNNGNNIKHILAKPNEAGTVTLPNGSQVSLADFGRGRKTNTPIPTILVTPNPSLLEWPNVKWKTQEPIDSTTDNTFVTAETKEFNIPIDLPLSCDDDARDVDIVKSWLLRHQFEFTNSSQQLLRDIIYQATGGHVLQPDVQWTKTQVSLVLRGIEYAYYHSPHTEFPCISYIVDPKIVTIYESNAVIVSWIISFFHRLLEHSTTTNAIIAPQPFFVILINMFNKYSPILNEHKYDIHLYDLVPISVRVHDRYDDFYNFLRFYERTWEVENTVLVVSHSQIDLALFDLIRNITFCKVKQLIHPMAGSLHGNKFPGDAGESIPDELDTYKHSRPYKLTRIKHHFWWLMGMMWTGLPEIIPPEFNGGIGFIEEDVWLNRDTVLTIRELSQYLSKDVFAINLATPVEHKTAVIGMEKVCREKDLFKFGWASRVNVGFVVNRYSWEQLSAPKSVIKFCTLDEVNWDSAVSYLQNERILPRANLAPLFTRAYHVGINGTNHQESLRTTLSQLEREFLKNCVSKIPKENRTWEVPAVFAAPTRNRLKFKGWGGWGHSFDQNLCFLQLETVDLTHL